MQGATSDDLKIASGLRRNLVIGMVATILIVSLGVTLATVFKNPWYFAAWAPALVPFIWTLSSLYREGGVRYRTPYYQYIENLQELPAKKGDPKFAAAMAFVKECADVSYEVGAEWGQPFEDDEVMPIVQAIQALRKHGEN